MPRAQGIYVQLPPVANDITVVDIARRVQAKEGAFQAKFNAKKAKQDDYYTTQKKSLSESVSNNPELT